LNECLYSQDLSILSQMKFHIDKEQQVLLQSQEKKEEGRR